MHSRWDDDDDDEPAPSKTSGAPAPHMGTAPPYGRRKGWVPRKPSDFGDGGAYPEIHVAQFPLGMGKGDATAGAIVPLSVDQDGQIKYDAILKQVSPCCCFFFLI